MASGLGPNASRKLGRRTAMADGRGPWRRPYGSSHPIMASGHGPGADRGLMGVRGKGGTRQARLSAADSVPDPLRAARDESEGYLDQRAAPCIQSKCTTAQCSGSIQPSKRLNLMQTIFCYGFSQLTQLTSPERFDQMKYVGQREKSLPQIVSIPREES